jgi:serine/threonine-protein kinase
MMVTETVRLDRQVAKGGMADVWTADHLTLGRRVAVKCMSAETAAEEGAMRRFMREARVASKLASPHALQVFDCVVSMGGDALAGAYMVMELLEGEDLASRIARLGRLSLADTAILVEQMADPLEEAHALGIIHRDVKPENIFLTTRNGRPCAKLLDFGVAKDLRDAGPDVTGAHIVVGTPHYMSPEQMMGLDVDSRCDVWSLAVVAYTCLTGRRPFDGATLAAVCIAIHDGDFERPSRLFGLPAWVDTFFERAFHPNADLRFRSVRALSGALRRVLADPFAEPSPRFGIANDFVERQSSIPISLIRPLRVARPFSA